MSLSFYCGRCDNDEELEVFVIDGKVKVNPCPYCLNVQYDNGWNDKDKSDRRLKALEDRVKNGMG